MARFARSPEGSAVLKQRDRFGWAALILDLGMRHPEKAPEIVKELRAFWRFVQREFEPLFTEDCLKLLERSDLASALRRKLAKSAPQQTGILYPTTCPPAGRRSATGAKA